MKLKRLTIGLKNSWDKDCNTYEGEIEFFNGHGGIKINLTEDQIAGILPVVADNLVTATKEATEAMTASVIEAIANKPVKQLEGN